MKLKFKGLREYFTDKEVREFNYVFDLGKFLQEFPQFSKQLDVKKIIDRRDEFGGIVGGDAYNEPGTMECVIRYTLSFIEDEDLFKEAFAGVSDFGQPVLEDGHLDFVSLTNVLMGLDLISMIHDQISSNALPAGQDWFIESIDVVD